MQNDPIAMLEEDHRTVEALFERYRSSPGPALVEQICAELSLHASLEEEIVYPVLGSDVPGGGDLQGEAESEHQEVKDAIAEIEAMGYADPSVDALMQTIMDSVTHHVEEEETEVLPRMRDALPEERLAELGEQLASARREQAGQLDLTEEALAEDLLEGSEA
jgi:hemerythrin superfamily protein